MSDQGLRRVVSTLLFDPAAQTLQIATLQQPQQRFLLLAPEMLRIWIVPLRSDFTLPTCTPLSIQLLIRGSGQYPHR